MTVLAVVASLIVGPPPSVPDDAFPIMREKPWVAVKVVSREKLRARRLVRYKQRVVRPYNWKLNRIAWCESTGRWFIATGNGFYGGLQFTLQTWWAVGGRGYPHQNSILEQKYRAVKVFLRRGNWGDWPVCQYA